MNLPTSALAAATLVAACLLVTPTADARDAGGFYVRSSNGHTSYGGSYVHRSGDGNFRLGIHLNSGGHGYHRGHGVYRRGDGYGHGDYYGYRRHVDYYPSYRYRSALQYKLRPYAYSRGHSRVVYTNSHHTPVRTVVVQPRRTEVVVVRPQTYTTVQYVEPARPARVIRSSSTSPRVVRSSSMYDADEVIRSADVSDHGASLTKLAWDALADARPRDAIGHFADIANLYGELGVPKIGFAITAARLGDLDKGVWAMRRAMAVDPDAIHHVPMNDELRLQVRVLRDRYARLGTNDGYYMAGRLSELLEDDASGDASMYDTSGFDGLDTGVRLDR